MRKIVKEFLVYDYKELSEEIKEKLLKRELEARVEDYCEFCLYDDLCDVAKNTLKKHFGDNAVFEDVLYDLSYSQGSGAMVEFNIDLLALNKKYKMLNKRKVKLLEKNYNDMLDVKVKHNNNSRYYHERTFYVDYMDVPWSGHDSWNELARRESLQDSIDALIDKFREDIVKVNEEIAKKGYDFIEDEEYFKSMALDLLDNQHYLENGDVYIG